MPVIQASILAGRSQEQKDAFIEGVTKVAMEALNVEAHQVRVLISEYPHENWGIAGISKARRDEQA